MIIIKSYTVQMPICGSDVEKFTLDFSPLCFYSCELVCMQVCKNLRLSVFAKLPTNFVDNKSKHELKWTACDSCPSWACEVTTTTTKNSSLKKKKKEPYLKYTGTSKTYIMTNGVDKASQKQLNASFTFTYQLSGVDNISSIWFSGDKKERLTSKLHLAGFSFQQTEIRS